MNASNLKPIPSLEQRVTDAFLAIIALEPDEAQLTCQAALSTFAAGMPIAPLFNFMDEAAFWTDMALPEEVEAYCLACFKAMPVSRQAAFLEFVQGKVAA